MPPDFSSISKVKKHFMQPMVLFTKEYKEKLKDQRKLKQFRKVSNSNLAEMKEFIPSETLQSWSCDLKPVEVEGEEDIIKDKGEVITDEAEVMEEEDTIMEEEENVKKEK